MPQYLCTVYVILIGQTMMNFASSSLFHEDLKEIHGAGILRKKSNNLLKNVTTDPQIHLAFESSSVPVEKMSVKKWHVGRVSQKQYEIVNMLWKETKPYLSGLHVTVSAKSSFNSNLSTASAGHTSIKIAKNSNLVQPTTPSFIEFYYFHEYDDATNSKLNPQIRLPIRNSSQFKTGLSPVLRFYINDLPVKRSIHVLPQNAKSYSTTNCGNVRLCINSLAIKISTTKTSPKTTPTKRTFYFRTEPGKRYVTKKIPLRLASSKLHFIENNRRRKNSTIENNTSISIEQKGTTAYDKIKFFQIYDRHTSIWQGRKEKPVYHNNSSTTVKGNGKNSSQRDIKSGNNTKQILVKNSSRETCSTNNIFDMSNIVTEKRNITKIYKGYTHSTFIPRDSESFLNISPISPLYNKSYPAVWSEYPFIAAYIHEPTQRYCDAAGLSPHWLLVAASCLSRDYHDSSPEGQSPFVAYCGESWRYPERVTYVKYSLTHPRFHPRDVSRRYMYNIGLIQVVTSMSSACSGWSPISLMSHQFLADRYGSTVTAVGWGIDRYGTSMNRESPKWPLMAYKAVAYSDSCPGSFGYRRLKQSDEENNTKNVYCLALPPYLGEESDPIHGGLLLWGGKLVAVYLQEERRSWGAQSAEYTGIWRHLPWIQETALESDRTDSFSLQI